MGFIERETHTMQVMRIKPDRSARNVQGHIFANAMHDLHQVYWKRWRPEWNGVIYANPFQVTVQDPIRFWYVVDMAFTEIKFYMSAPAGEPYTFMHHRLNRYWPKATYEPEVFPRVQHENTDVIELGLEKHNIFGLDVERDKDLTPIADILSVHADFREGDRAVIAYCFEPYDRVSWADIADRAYAHLSTGKVPKRTNLHVGFDPLKALEFVNDQLYEVHDILFSGDSGREEAKKKDRQRNKKPTKSAEQVVLSKAADFKPTTRNKRTEPTFKAWIRVCVTSQDKDRRKVLTRSFGNAYAALRGENALQARPGKEYVIDEVNDLHLTKRSVLNPDASIYSSTEVGKFIQLPTASLQDEYKELMESVEHRETELPERVLKAGIVMGSVSYKGQIYKVAMPTDNEDELCLPRIIIGGMGTGKTKGYGANLAIEALKLGLSSFTIDTAKGEMAAEIGEWARANGYGDKFIHIKFGDKPVGLDWCEIAGSNKAVNRFAAEVLSFFELRGADTGLETKRYIRLAAKTVASVGGSRLSDVAQLFLDKEHLKSMMEELTKCGREDLTREWLPFLDLSQGMKGKVLEPILNRIDMLRGDDYLAECLDCETNSIDIRNWINGGYAVCFDIPKRELGDEATDLIAGLLVAKTWLATLWRYQRVKETPCFLIMDEPHTFMSSAAHWKQMVVESRKYRLGLAWMFHSWEQIPRDLAKIIKSAMPHYHIYTSSKETYKDLSEEIAPFTVEEAMKTPYHHAINVIRSGGQVIPPFMAEMTPPPSMQKVQVTKH